MNMKEAVISVFKNWNNFSGRACRSEYWYFYLAATLTSMILAIVEAILGLYDPTTIGPLSGLFSIILVVPSIAVAARRLQDRGISGWWQLSYITVIGILVIAVLLMLPAKEDENKWGRNPLLDM